MGSLTAQDSDEWQWVQYYNQWQINSNWSLLSDASYRWKGGFQEKSQYLLRTGVGFKVRSQLRIGGGIAISRRFKRLASTFEIRPYQELLYAHALRKWNISQRLRVEERFFQPVNSNTTQSSNDFNWRFRYQLSASIPLIQLSKTQPDKKFLIGFSNEIMFNAGTDKGNKPFDQNRLMISPTLAFNKQLSVSLTLMYLHRYDYTSESYRDNGVFWLQIRQQIGQ